MKRLAVLFALVIALLPEFAKLIDEGKIEVQGPHDRSQVPAPLITFTLDWDRKVLFLNIHSSKFNAAYGISRTVGPDDLWQAILENRRRR